MTRRSLLAGVALILIGFAVGNTATSYVMQGKPKIRYQASLAGTVYITTLASENECGYVPNDDWDLSSVIITDGETRGFPLGGTGFFAIDLQPSDGYCRYEKSIMVRLSPTGIYELAFSEIEADGPGQGNTFRKQPIDAIPSALAARIAPSELRWFFTTVACPNKARVCVED